MTLQLGKGFKLFIWLLRLVIKASNPNNQEQFKYVHLQLGVMVQAATPKYYVDLVLLAKEYC